MIEGSPGAEGDGARPSPGASADPGTGADESVFFTGQEAPAETVDLDRAAIFGAQPADDDDPALAATVDSAPRERADAVLSALYGRRELNTRRLVAAHAEQSVHHELLTLDVPGVEEAFLLDGEGRIVVRSSEGGERLAGGQLHDALALAPFPYRPVVEAALTRRAGFVQVQVDGRPRLFTVNPLETIGWSFVTRVAAEAERAR